METQEAGTEIKATYKETQWGGNTATFTQRAATEEEAQKRADENGWELVSTEEVTKYELV